MAWIQQSYYDDSTGQNVPVWLDEQSGEWSYTDPNQKAAPTSLAWAQYELPPEQQPDPEFFGNTKATGYRWEGPGAENMKNVGVVHSPSTGIDGAIFTDGQGNYFHNGQKLPWDDEQAAGQLGATATAMRQEQEHNDSGLNGAINSFFDQYMPVLILGGAAAAVSFGSLAGAGATTTEAAVAGGEAASEGLISSAGATKAIADAGAYSVAPGYVSGTGALEAAVGNAAGQSLIPGSLTSGTAAASAAPTIFPALINSTVEAAPFNAGQELATHPDELASVEGGSTQTGWTTPPAAPAPFTTGSKVVDWAAKQVIGSVAKGVVTSMVGGGAPAPGGGSGAGSPAPAALVSFGTFGLLDWTSAFKPVKKTKFQPDKTALENSGIAYSPR